jgi:hypothetical protein
LSSVIQVMDVEKALLRFYESYADWCGVSLDEAMSTVLKDFAVGVLEQLTPEELNQFISSPGSPTGSARPTPRTTA